MVRRQPLPAYEIVKPAQPEWFKEIDTLGLSARTRNALARSDVVNLRAIDEKSDEELLRIRSFGQKALREVRDKLEGFRNYLIVTEAFMRERGQRGPVIIPPEDSEPGNRGQS